MKGQKEGASPPETPETRPHPNALIAVTSLFSLSATKLRSYRHVIHRAAKIGAVKLPNLIAAIPLIFTALPSLSETGYVTVLVQDAHQHPVRLVEIGIEKGVSKLTKDDGEAQLPLAQTIKADDWITFQLVHSPPGKDLAIVSPWDNRIPVPSFADKSENLIKIVVVERGDRAALESGTILASLAARINKANAPNSANQKASPPDPKEALLAVAKQYGLTAEDIDSAIRAWGDKTTDPYEAGLAALYERNYPKATAALEDSLKQRKQKLETDQKLVNQDQKGVADAAFFLGQSLFAQGRYRESAESYEECRIYRPNDASVLNNLALSLEAAADYNAAEPLARQALAIDEKALGPDHPVVAINLSVLGSLQQAKGDYAAAEPLLRRALAIDEKALGPEHSTVAINLANLAWLLKARGDYAGAELLLRRALAIDEKALGPNHPDVAIVLDDLASLFQDKSDFVTAESLYRRALAIDEKALGPDHPTVAEPLQDLASLFRDQHNYAAAEPLYRRALAIDEKTFGPDNRNLLQVLDDLASVLQDEGNYAAAVPYRRRILEIAEKVFGPDDNVFAYDLTKLALLLKKEGDLAGAEQLYRRALAIDEKKRGSDNPEVAVYLDSLAMLLQDKGDLAGAEQLYRRAVAIEEKARGPNDPTTALYLNKLASVLEAKGDLTAAETLLRRALAIDEKALGPDQLVTKKIRDHLNDIENRLTTAHK
jgi:tetratricopeptide (TPR) repeat protein